MVYRGKDLVWPGGLDTYYSSLQPLRVFNFPSAGSQGNFEGRENIDFTGSRLKQNKGDSN
jgi:hypothetical protein